MGTHPPRSSSRGDCRLRSIHSSLDFARYVEVGVYDFSVEGRAKYLGGRVNKIGFEAVRYLSSTGEKTQLPSVKFSFARSHETIVSPYVIIMVFCFLFLNVTESDPVCPTWFSVVPPAQMAPTINIPCASGHLVFTRRINSLLTLIYLCRGPGWLD